MLEFFKSIGDWFVTNKSAILLTISSIDFSALMVLGYNYFRQRHEVKANTASTEALNSALAANNKLVDDVEEIKKENKALKEELNNMMQSQELLLNKLNAMLEVQSIVYSTIKNESTRVTVSNILSNAKYAETTTRAKVKEELESLREQVAEQAKALSDKVQTVVDDTKSIVDTGVKQVITRY